MRFNSAGAYLTVVREMYEAYCVWSFMSLMMEFLHNVATLRRSTAEKGQAHTEEELATLETQFLRYDANGGKSLLQSSAVACDFSIFSHAVFPPPALDWSSSSQAIRRCGCDFNGVSDRLLVVADGFIDLEELSVLFQELNLNLTRAELTDVMDNFDQDGDGRLGREEFLQIMALKMTDQDVREAFSALDKDNSRSLTIAEFTEVAMAMGYDEQVRTCSLLLLLFNTQIDRQLAPCCLPGILGAGAARVGGRGGPGGRGLLPRFFRR